MTIVKHLCQYLLTEQRKEEKWFSSGGVVYRKDSKGKVAVCIVAPTGGYGGYSWTFPKGRVDAGESKEKTAMREVAEEAGILAAVEKNNAHLGQFEGTMSFTDYFVMRYKGDNKAAMDAETSEVKWVTPKEAKKLLNSSRDQAVLQAFEKWLLKNNKALNV